MQSTLRYGVSGQAGSLNGRRWAVLDRHDRQGGKGMKRVEFHRTQADAIAAARRLNRQCVQCGEVAPAHKTGCTFAGLERDHTFGGEYAEPTPEEETT